jgi:hypothetical protein
MSDSKPFPWLPLSIVIAGALIGAGLFAGLRSRSTAAPAATPAAFPVVTASTSSTTSTTPNQAQPASDGLTVAEASKALAPQRKIYLEACGAGIGGIGFHITFDGAGGETSRSVMIPPNSTADEKVVGCAASVKAEPLTILPRGQAVTVDVPMPPP